MFIGRNLLYQWGGTRWSSCEVQLGELGETDYKTSGRVEKTALETVFTRELLYDFQQ